MTCELLLNKKNEQGREGKRTMFRSWERKCGSMFLQENQAQGQCS